MSLKYFRALASNLWLCFSISSLPMESRYRNNQLGPQCGQTPVRTRTEFHSLFFTSTRHLPHCRCFWHLWSQTAEGSADQCSGRSSLRVLYSRALAHHRLWEIRFWIVSLEQFEPFYQVLADRKNSELSYWLYHIPRLDPSPTSTLFVCHISLWSLGYKGLSSRC